MARSITSNSIAALIASLALGATARAEDIRVVTTVAVKAALSALVPVYEKASGDKVVLVYESSMNQKADLEGGGAFDLALTSGALMDSIVEKKMVAEGTRQAMGSVVASIAYKHGTKAPDVSSPEALKAELASIKTISFSDPAAGGASSIYFQGVLKRLGLSDLIKGKEIVTKPGDGAGPVGEGRAEIGIAQSSEAAMVDGVDSVPLFPADPASKTPYFMGVSAKAEHPKGARAFEAFLKSPESAAVMKTKGIAVE